MTLKESWPYLAGAGLLLVLLLLSKGNGGSTEYKSIAALPDPGGDALALAKENNRAGVIGSLLNVGGSLENTALGYAGSERIINAQGRADTNSITARYAGEGALADIASRTQSAIASISAGRDIRLADYQFQTNVEGFRTAQNINSVNNQTARDANQRGYQLGMRAFDSSDMQNRENNAAGVTNARTNADAARDVASTTQRGETQRNTLNVVGNIVGGVLQAFNPLSWF